jgi:tetratricopeptide (TPR) repeat protein
VLIADPDNVDALIASARTDPAGAFFAAAEAKVTQALSWVPDHARGHMALGIVYIYTKRAAEGIAECEHALAIDRNLAQAHAFIGFGKTTVGRPEETEAHIVEALRLSPRDTMPYSWMSYAGVAKNYLGLYDQAIPWFRRAIEANRNFPHPHFVLGVALALLGRLDEARSSVWAGLALNPTFTISRARRQLDGDERRSDPSGPVGAASRRSAQSRSPRTMTTAHRLAATLDSSAAC